MKAKTLFYCTECGNETAKWAGKCPACGAWNTIVEQPERPKGTGKGASVRVGMTRRRACPVTDLTADEEIRFPTGMGELDRVLGGGAVKGSLVLVGGAPGIGKSTLLLQISGILGKTRRVLYVSGEESGDQLGLRAAGRGMRCCAESVGRRYVEMERPVAARQFRREAAVFLREDAARARGGSLHRAEAVPAVADRHREADRAVARRRGGFRRVFRKGPGEGFRRNGDEM